MSNKLKPIGFESVYKDKLNHVLYHFKIANVCSELISLILLHSLKDEQSDITYIVYKDPKSIYRNQILRKSWFQVIETRFCCRSRNIV
jgi:hypothetical protein